MPVSAYVVLRCSFAMPVSAYVCRLSFIIFADWQDDKRYTKNDIRRACLREAVASLRQRQGGQTLNEWRLKNLVIQK